MRAWMVRAGQNGEREQAVVARQQVIAGWPEVGDLSGIDDRESLQDLLRRTYPDASSALLANWTGQLWRFIRIISQGDVVALPLKGENRHVVLGRIIGDYHYDAAADLGERHVRAVKWVRKVARSELSTDLLDSLGALLTVAEISRHHAARRLETVMAGGADPGWLPEGAHTDGFDSKADFLEQAVASSSSSPICVTTRQVLEVWGASRRTDSLIVDIEQELADSGLMADPSLSEGWLDRLTQIVPIEVSTDLPHPRSYAQRGDSPPAPVSVSISTLRSANASVVSIGEDDDLKTAITLMLTHDFSQLAVINPQGDITGVVSWESVGRARLAGVEPTLRDATVPARTVTLDADLLGVVAEVSSREYVFVRETGHHKPVGIVTVADLSQQFYSMVQPFTLVEEVERRLRRITDEKIPVTTIKAIAGSGKKDVSSAADLTMGAYKQLYKDPETFQRLSWPVDHSIFRDLLAATHALRNRLMHFSTDPLDARDIGQAEAFLNMLRVVDPRP